MQFETYPTNHQQESFQGDSRPMSWASSESSSEYEVTEDLYQPVPAAVCNTCKKPMVIVVKRITLKGSPRSRGNSAASSSSGSLTSKSSSSSSSSSPKLKPSTFGINDMYHLEETHMSDVSLTQSACRSETSLASEMSTDSTDSFTSTTSTCSKGSRFRWLERLSRRTFSISSASSTASAGSSCSSCSDDNVDVLSKISSRQGHRHSPSPRRGDYPHGIDDDDHHHHKGHPKDQQKPREYHYHSSSHGKGHPHHHHYHADDHCRVIYYTSDLPRGRPTPNR